MASKVPPSLKGVAHYVKIANENASRDAVVYYWALFFAVQEAMKLDKSSPEALQWLTSLLGTLEAIKKQLAGNEAVTNELVASAHLENFAFKLFNFADAKEKTGHVDKTVVHAFYTAGYVMDILSLFGEIDDNIASAKKYAKWKSTQIFTCLRDGTPYVPSSQQSTGNDFGFEGFSNNDSSMGLPPAPTYGTEYSNPTPPPLYGTNSTSAGSSLNMPNIPPHSSPVPTHASTLPAHASTLPAHSATSVTETLSSAAFLEARKYAKYAVSALDYEDRPSSIDNLKKALAILEGNSR